MILPVLMSPACLDKEITENSILAPTDMASPSFLSKDFKENSILGVTDVALLNNTANDSKILPESALIGFTSITDGDENMNTMEV